MKRFFTLIILTVISLSGYAQQGNAPNWISLAFKGGYGNSVFLSSQALKVDGFQPDYLSRSLFIGGRLGVVFFDKVGVSAEYLVSQYHANHECKCISNITNVTEIAKSNFKMKASDLLLLFRYTGTYGFYCELGPKFTSVKDFTRETIENQTADTKDVSDMFKHRFTSLVFGFGLSPVNGERVIISLGIRAAYCMKSFYDSKDNNPYGISGMNGKFQNPEINPLSVQFVLDINYHFARFGSANCGKQKIIFFK